MSRPGVGLDSEELQRAENGPLTRREPTMIPQSQFLSIERRSRWTTLLLLPLTVGTILVPIAIDTVDHSVQLRAWHSPFTTVLKPWVNLVLKTPF